MLFIGVVVANAEGPLLRNLSNFVLIVCHMHTIEKQFLFLEMTLLLYKKRVAGSRVKMKQWLLNFLTLLSTCDRNYMNREDQFGEVLPYIWSKCGEKTTKFC